MKYEIKNAPFIVLCVTACFCACARMNFDDAARLEQQGRHLKAAASFEHFAKNYPSDPRAPESLYRAAAIYAEELSLCAKAVPLYEGLARAYPGARPWAQLAARGVFSCPDYFPTEPGRKWVYGDSQTGGRNMKQYSAALAESDPLKAKIETSVYAGSKLVRKITRLYSRDNWELTEKEAGRGLTVCILKYPFSKGRSWSSGSAGSAVRFTIEDDSAVVKTRAGSFDNCLKVRQQLEGIPSWLFEYYAPGVGRVLTTVAGKGFENRNTELLSYEKKNGQQRR